MHDFKKKVKEYFHLQRTDGDVGIEIEMEFNGLLNPLPLENNWKFEHDGSLRGQSVEMVLKKPCTFQSVPKIIQNLRSFLKDNNIEILNSVRAGIHIHINMQKHTIQDVLHFMLCYYPMEVALTRFCGQTRSGNLFCLRARDAEFILERLKSSIEHDDIYQMRTNALRYSALNIQSLFSYGSVEFRAMATTPGLDNIEEWCDILRRIKEYALKIDDPWDNISKISGMGPRQWMADIIGDKYVELLDYPELEKDMMQEVRQLQYICSILNMKGL